jgi:hypothetical protein
MRGDQSSSTSFRIDRLAALSDGVSLVTADDRLVGADDCDVAKSHLSDVDAVGDVTQRHAATEGLPALVGPPS